MSNEFAQTHRIEPTLPEADVTGLDSPVSSTPSSGASVTSSYPSSSSSTTETAKESTKQVAGQAAESDHHDRPAFRAGLRGQEPGA